HAAAGRGAAEGVQTPRPPGARPRARHAVDGRRDVSGPRLDLGGGAPGGRWRALPGQARRPRSGGERRTGRGRALSVAPGSPRPRTTTLCSDLVPGDDKIVPVDECPSRAWPEGRVAVLSVG